MDYTEKQNSDYTQSGMETSALSDPSRFPEYSSGTLISDGRYKIISVLGHGASGCVYEVEQVYMKKRLAMKVLLSAQVSESTTKRFQKEAQAASRLDHPNLVHAVDFGMLDGTQPYLVMDLVIGTTLASYIRVNGPLPLDMATEIFIAVSLALDYAHREGVVHRDLKPSNIILERAPGRPHGFIPKIVDFGIAKVDLLDETALTRLGEVLGTPLYMSPEQCAGEPVDYKSDIYSLGCVIFESLTGTPPFSGKTSLVTMMLHRNEAPPAMKEASMGVEFPRSVETMMAKMLAKKPNDRYSSCMAIAQDFEYLKRGEFQKVAAAVPVQQSNATSRASNKFVVIAAVVALFLMLVTGVTVYLLQNSKTPVSSPAPPVVAKEAAPRDAQFDTYHFADITEGSYIHSSEGVRIYTFPDKDAIGTLYWWNKGALNPEQHLALNTFETPLAAKPIFDLGWTIIDHNAGYMRGFDDNLLRGALIKIRANWTVWGNDDCLKRTLELLERQAESLQILQLEAVQSKGFVFTKDQINSINKLRNVQWLYLRRTGIATKDLIQLKFFPHLKVLALREVSESGVVLKKLKENKQLHRLSIFDCKLEATDFRGLAHNGTLRMLELSHLHAPDSKEISNSEILSCIAKISNLEYLCVDSWILENNADGIKLLTALKKLKAITISDASTASPELVTSIKDALPHCEVGLSKNDGHSEVQAWCDPLRTNPSDVLSWN